MYYKSKYLGVVGVQVEDIKHQDGDYTFLAGRKAEHSFIKTSDLHKSFLDAENGKVAEFSIK